VHHHIVMTVEINNIT